MRETSQLLLGRQWLTCHWIFFFFALLIRHFRVHLRDLRMLLLFVVVVFSYICSCGLWSHLCLYKHYQNRSMDLPLSVAYHRLCEILRGIWISLLIRWRSYTKLDKLQMEIWPILKENIPLISVTWSTAVQQNNRRISLVLSPGNRYHRQQ